MATIYDKASLVMIPSGVKENKLYSIKPTDGSGDFTVTRAGKKNRINSDLNLELIDANVPALNYDAIGGCPVLNTEPQATNLITYPISYGNSYWTKSGASIEGDPSTAGSEEFTNGTFTGSSTGWVTPSGWTYGSNALTYTGTSGSFLETTIAPTVGSMVLLEYVISASTINGSLSLVGNRPSSAGYKVVPKTVGTHRYYMQIDGTTPTNFAIFVTGNTTGSITFDSFSMKEVQGYSAPSVDFSTSAFKLVEDTSTATHFIVPASNIAVVNSSAYTQSIFVKPNGRTKIGFRDSQGSGKYASFNLSNGTLIEQNGDAFSIDPFLNGWYRISITMDASGTNWKPTLYLLPNSYTTGSPQLSTYTGDGTSGVYLFMSQVETGSVATSPTFTDITLAAEGSTSTRIADVVTGAGDVNTFNSPQGTLFIDTKSFADGDKFMTFGIEKDANNYLAIIYRGTAGVVWTQTKVGGVETTIQLSGIPQNVNNKMAFAWNTNYIRFYVNGVLKSTSSSFTTFGADVLDELNFQNIGGTEQWFADTKSIQVYNTALSDAELISLTTI